jgi:hypothetical protein
LAINSDLMNFQSLEVDLTAIERQKAFTKGFYEKHK